MTCILLNNRSQYGKATYCMNSISRYFGKGRTIKTLKTSVVTRESTLKKREINRYSVLGFRVLKYPALPHNGHMAV